MPVSILIDSMDSYLPLLKDSINDSLRRDIFSNELKLSEVITLLKKNDSFDKTNYRPVSLPSYISEVFGSIIYNQINKSTKPFLSKVPTGFGKKHNTQHSLLKC